MLGQSSLLISISNCFCFSLRRIKHASKLILIEPKLVFTSLLLKELAAAHREQD